MTNTREKNDTNQKEVTSMMTEGERIISGIDTKGTILRSMIGGVVETTDIQTNRDTITTGTTQTTEGVILDGMSIGRQTMSTIEGRSRIRLPHRQRNEERSRPTRWLPVSHRQMKKKVNQVGAAKYNGIIVGKKGTTTINAR